MTAPLPALSVTGPDLGWLELKLLGLLPPRTLIGAGSNPNVAAAVVIGIEDQWTNRVVEGIAKTGKPVASIRKMTIWGNHSSTQYPDLSQTTVDGTPALQLVDQAWYESDFIPTVAKRGAAIIEARGSSSAASAASAAVDHMRDWALGTADGDWVSMGVPSDGSYGIPEGVIYGYPVTCNGGRYEIVKGIDLSPFSRGRMDATHKELLEERDAVQALLG